MLNHTAIESHIERPVLDMIPRLVAIDGPLSGRTFYLDGPVLSIGRLVSNDIYLEDPFVSRHHSVIRNQDGQYLIEDVNSANGTYVDGQRVDAGPIKEGSIIQIGASRFLFRIAEDLRSEISDLRSIA